MGSRQIRLDLGKGAESRLAAMLVQVASRYDSSVHVEHGNHHVNAKSIMGMMSLALPEDGRIRIEADGPDEEKALQGLETFCRG